MKTRSDTAVLRWLFRQARPYWGHLGIIFSLDLLATPLALLAPVPLMIAVDSAIGSKPLPGFLQALLPQPATTSATVALGIAVTLVVLVAVVTQLQKFGNWWLQTYVGEKLALEFRGKLLGHAQRLSAVYHDKKGTADAIYRIQYDAPAIQWIIIHGISPFITAVFTLGSMLFVTAALDAQLAVVALAVSPVLFLLANTFRSRLRTQWKQVKHAESSALSVIQEVLTALRVVQAFGREQRESARFLRQSWQGLSARMRVVVSESMFGLAMGLTIALGTAIVLYLGVRHVQDGLLTLGELLLVMAYLAQLYQPLQAIGQQIGKLQGGLTSAERALALLAEEPTVVERPHALPIARADGAIRFEGVSFGYEPGHNVLHDLSFSVAPGSRVGIAGRTGAGKTTLISLLMRFYDPTSGRILLDGQDLASYRLADLREQFAVVLQESVLFSASIRENIAYGRPEATDDEIVNAAKAANADEFIREMPDGYDTVVGERGMRLSGGQRQRIALARAFLRDAPILILDEPTSAVDVKTEALIMDALDRLMTGRTTFIIAHRLSTLKKCNMTLTLDHGRLLPHRPDSDMLAVTA